MLYDTHKRYGQVAGLVALPVVAGSGMVDFSFDGFVANDSVILTVAALALFVLVALQSSMFGAEFPDIDSKGSIPAQNHRLLALIFRACGVKHRGKFSHDFLTQTVLWGVAFVGLLVVEELYVVNETELFVFAMLKTFVVFTWVGVMSHLIADAMTVDGVWFAGRIKVRFMPVAIRKVEVFGFKPFKTWFATASIWNEMNYKFMTVMIPVAGIFSAVGIWNMI